MSRRLQRAKLTCSRRGDREGRINVESMNARNSIPNNGGSWIRLCDASWNRNRRTHYRRCERGFRCRRQTRVTGAPRETDAPPLRTLRAQISAPSGSESEESRVEEGRPMTLSWRASVADVELPCQASVAAPRNKAAGRESRGRACPTNIRFVGLGPTDGE